MTSWLYYFIRTIIGIFSLGLLWVIGLGIFIHSIPHESLDDLKNTDGIVIFTGSHDRIKVGIELAKRNLSSHLLISGVDPETKLKDILNKNDSVSLQKNLHITLGYSALHTYGNATETIEWANKHHLTTIYLVTSNYHLPRSLLELRQQTPYLKIIPYPVIEKGFQKPQWWLNKSLMLRVIEEYQKYIYAFMRQFFKKNK